MSKKLLCLAVCAAVSSSPVRASAQAAALLAVADPAQLSEVRLAKVMAEGSSLWLSVSLKGSTKLALVTAEAEVEAAPGADAWLRALDFATRVRVAAPLGPLANCGALQQFEPDDTGLPEPPSVAAFEVESAGSELELRRRLSDAGLPADVERVARFTGAVQPPFRVALYDVPASGGDIQALRLVDWAHPTSLPQIAISGAPAASLTLIALATDGVQPISRESAEPTEFPVLYRAIAASSDYLGARGDWLTQNPSRWLNEVQATEPMFAQTTLPSGARIESVVSRYFSALREQAGSPCEARVRAAYERGSKNAEDFTCDGADDLARALTEVGFAELRSSRFWGRLGDDGAKFQVVASGSRGPLLFATDFDRSGCPADVSLPVRTPTPSNPPPPMSTAPVEVSAPDDPYYGRTPTTRVYSEGSCTGAPSEPQRNDTCSGDPSSSDSSSDSCSGDTSSGDTSSDSCSGDTSSGDTSSDSCSGDTSSGDTGGDSCSGDTSSGDTSGDSCSGDSSDSEYDGDTCSGDSAESNSTRAKQAALRAQPAGSLRARARPRPRHVRLSLVTLLAAALALPLRRRCASR